MADARSGRRPPRWTMQARAPITPPIAPGHGARGSVCRRHRVGDHVGVRIVRKGVVGYVTPSALYAQGLASAF